MGRVSFITQFEQPKRNLMSNTNDIQQTMEQISTGKQISRPSDSPPDMVRLFEHHNEQGRIGQYKDNITSARNELETAEGSLGEVTNLLQRVRELSVQAANDSLSDRDRELISAEVDERIEELVDVANNRLAGQFLFGGTETEDLDQLFTVERDGQDQIQEVQFNGDFNPTNKQIGDGEFIPSNLIGSEIFQATNESARGDFETVAFDTDPDVDEYDFAEDPLKDHNNIPKSKGYFQLNDRQVYYDTNEDTIIDVAERINDMGITVESMFEEVRGVHEDDVVDLEDNEITIAQDDLPVDVEVGDRIRIKDDDGDQQILRIEELEFDDDEDEVTIRLDDDVDDPDDVQSVQFIDSAGIEHSPTEARELDEDNHDVQFKLKSRTPHEIYLRDFDRNPANGDGEQGLLNDLGIIGQNGEPPEPRERQNYPVEYHDGAFREGKSIFDTLIDFRNTLQGEPPADVENEAEGFQQSIEEIQLGVENILVHRSIAGARVNRLDSAENRIEDRELHTQELISQLEDADLAEVITEHERLRTVQEASLQMSSNIMQLSLANFI